MQVRCSLLSAIIDLVLLPFRRHVEVLASENTENGSRETMRTGERETVQYYELGNNREIVPGKFVGSSWTVPGKIADFC